MIEGEYLELVNQLKEDFDKKDKEVLKIKEDNTRLKKELMSIYGYIRILDYMADSTFDMDFELKGLIDVLRSYTSNLFDELFDSDE
jgi:hypothetical protein